MGAKKPPLPFSHAPLLSVLTHTLWFLPSVAACHAMANLLKQKQNALRLWLTLMTKLRTLFTIMLSTN